jgi:lipoprotein-releasing system permease protein
MATPGSMSPNFRIALRFLTAKKRSMLMSLACTVLGVGLFIVTQATTSGFEGFFIKTILGTDGAMRIQDKMQNTMQSIAAGGSGSSFSIEQKNGRKYIEGIDNPALLEETLRTFPNISGISEVLHGAVTIRSSFKDEIVQAYGIYLDKHRRVSDLESQIVQGSLLDFRTSPSGALVGREMADRMQLEVGDSFQLEAQSQIRRYKVSAIYETGVSDIDRVRIYLNMPEARSLLKKPTGASYIQINLVNKDSARADAAHLQDVLGYSAAAWQDREKTWLEVFRALRISTGITVSVFTLIAGLAMFSTLTLIVLEKTKDIAILRSMGYTRRDILHIFLWQAAIVLVIGTILGCGLGASVTYGVSQMPLRIRGIFATDRFIVYWSIWHYVAAVSTAAIMVMVASIWPANRAARLEPGDIIRGTAQ